MTTVQLLTGLIIRININDYWTQATTAEADTYHTARGNALWTGADPLKPQALQRAWDYMSTLPWIEECFTDYVGIPDDVKNAQILLALEELKAPGVLTPALTREDYVSNKGIASGAVSKSYRADAPAWKRFRGVDLLLGPYISSSVNVRIERG